MGFIAKLAKLVVELLSPSMNSFSDEEQRRNVLLVHRGVPVRELMEDIEDLVEKANKKAEKMERVG